MADTRSKLRIVYGDATLGIHGEDFHYIFSYQRGGLESLVQDGMEWLYRVPQPTFWRALTDNDRGSLFHIKSGIWLSADLFIKCVGREVTVDGKNIGIPGAPFNNQFSAEETAETVKIVFTYETITVPSARVEVSYEIYPDGKMSVSAWYQGKAGVPELPVFGMRFIMPTCAVGYRYDGLSGETYPDRMAGGKEGVYKVDGLPVTPYLVPQDCGMHMQTNWLEVYRNTELDNRKKKKDSSGKTKIHTLRFEAEKGTFAFSCLPYTSAELENATHQEELPPPRRTVVCILGAVRGVGGIDSWGSDVEENYHISGEDEIRYSFSIVKQQGCSGRMP